jgi:DNA-binding transcriptional MerR regulator
MHPTTGEKLPISAVTRLTGVNAITLRAWERRYGVVRPLRTPKGHRLYTHEHVELIRRVLTLVERGVPISRAREALESSELGTAAVRARGAWRSHIERMSAAIARFDEHELDRLYDEALAIHSIEHVTQQLLLPLLVHLGERWKDLAGGIAEEHFFAMYLRTKLGARLQHRMRLAEGPRLLSACAPGEQHEIGLLLFALKAHAAGLQTVLLGADMPLEEIAVAQRRALCDGVVISSSMDPAPGLFESSLPKLVRQAGVPVFLGGATATRHRAAISAAGAIPLGSDVEEGVRLLLANLDARKGKR